MALESIEHKFIDPNLYSGSFDKLRTALGEMFYDAHSGSAEGEYIDFVDFDDADVADGSSNDWFAWKSNIDLKQEPVVSGTILPNYRFPVRLEGHQSQFDDDVEWLLYLMGGEGSEQTYAGIYTPSSFDDFMFTFETQYSTRQSKIITEITEDEGGRTPYRAQYSYNYYLRNYQNSILSTPSVTTLPNIYLLDLFNNAAVNGEGLDFHDVDFTKQYVTLMEEVDEPTIEALFDPSYTSYMPPHEDADLTTSGFVDNTKNIRDYLDISYAQTTLSQSVLTTMSSTFQNIIFDYSASFANTLMYNFDMYSGTDDLLDLWPYYVDIEYPKFEYYDSDEGKEVRASLIAHGYTARFTKLLKEIFLNEQASLRPKTMTYSDVSVEYGAMRTSDGAIKTSENTTVQDTSIKYIDFMKFMQFAYNNYNSLSDNCFIMRPPDVESVAAYDTQGIYRFYNTIAASKVIDDVCAYISTNSNYDIQSMSDLFNKAGTPKYREVLAYRIEKVRNSPAPGSSTVSNNTQNIWVFNVPDTETWTGYHPDASSAGTHFSNELLKYIDTQVKYGESYTYKIYAYVLVIGHKYSYSDLAVARTITDDLDGADTRCVEFYNPFTGNAKDQLFVPWSDNPLSGSEADGPLNRFADNSHALVDGDTGYLADFYLTYEPSMRIMEMPIGEKLVTVLDNPGPAWEVAPFYFFDNTDRIGFELILEAEQDLTVPTGLGGTAQKQFGTYIASNDIIPGEKITVDSISRIRSINVYRSTEYPESWEVLANNLYTSLDLSIDNGNYTYTRTNFIDTINTNASYYYVFVGVNEQGIQTHPSPVYRAQLVDDLGYKYANFDIVHDKDLRPLLEREGEPQPTNTFRNFMGLVLKARHTMPDVTSVDLEETAESQLDNLVLGQAADLIWDRNFKVRLTSKKTGKKLDLNITYKAESE